MDKFIQNATNKPNILMMNDNRSTSSSHSIRRSLIVKTEIPTLNLDTKLNPIKPNITTNNNENKNDIGAILDKINTIESEFENGDEISNADEIDEKDMANFKENVKKWIELDDKISEYARKAQLLKKERTELNTDILKFMKNYSIEDLNTNNGKLEYRVKNLKKGFTAKKIHENLVQYFKTDKEQAENIYKYLLNSRICLDKEFLKRIKK